MAPKKGKFNSFKKKLPSENAETEIQRLNELCQQFDSSKATNFNDFPLSRKTQQGLKNGGFSSPTEIQKDSIGLALQNADILGAAKTGSGKTLAFIIPVLEKLYKLRWSHHDGLGVLIVTPTRELAYQIFEVLRKVGNAHDFSAGLIIGGQNLKAERNLRNTPNIIIGTPGRLLHHFDKNVSFNGDNLQMLILDEADQILEMGFQQDMNSIISYLPEERQTLLFSATQTKSVKDLARLSLKDPVYVSIHENAKHSTPEALQQWYLVCNLEHKINLLWSFIKNHLKQKILVFMTCCKQVQYFHETFRRLSPGMLILALHGNMHQARRMAVYDDFYRKQSAVLFSTDLAARGLDFPSVNWILQLDCPENANAYIHRAGRTARHENAGECLLVLLPSEEEEMLKQLQGKDIPIVKTEVNPKRQYNIGRKLKQFLVNDTELKQSAQRALKSYIKSIHVMKKTIPYDHLTQFAQSLGLDDTPRLRFLQKSQKQIAIATEQLIKSDVVKAESSDDEELNEDPTDIFHDLLVPISKLVPDGSFEESEDLDVPKRGAKVKSKTHVIFDEDGKVAENRWSIVGTGEVGGIDIAAARALLEEQDRADKELQRKRIKELHKKQKEKRKRANREAAPEEEAVVTLGNDEDEGSEADDDDDVNESGADDDNTSEDDDEDGSESEATDDDDDDDHTLTISGPERKRRKTCAFDREVESSCLSKDEELALQLLKTME